jgi:hypothetical protein
MSTVAARDDDSRGEPDRHPVGEDDVVGVRYRVVYLDPVSGRD